MYRVLYERSCLMLLPLNALKQLLWKSLTYKFVSKRNDLFKQYITAEFLLIESYVQGVLRKVLFFARFVDGSNTLTHICPICAISQSSVT